MRFFYIPSLSLQGQVSLWLIALLSLFAIAAGFFSPYHYQQEFRQYAYHPPMRIHFFDQEGIFHWQPFIYATKPAFKDGRKQYQEIQGHRYPLTFFVKGSAYYIFGCVKTDRHFFGIQNTDIPFFLLGSDWNGRDMVSRILYGGRISLSVGMIAIVISMSIGVAVGSIAGFLGGICDKTLMRVIELLMSIPSFYLMLALRAVFPIEMSSVQVYFLIVFIMAFLGWPSFARIIRGMVLSLREREFVIAAQALGMSNTRIICVHIVPHIFSFVLVSAIVSVPAYILGESALSLLGVGITEPYASWGNMLTKALHISTLVNYPWILFPCLFIFLVVTAFNMLGDALQKAYQ